MKYTWLFVVLLVGCKPNHLPKLSPTITSGDTVLLDFKLSHQGNLKFDGSDHANHQDKQRANYPLRVVAGRKDVINGFDEVLLSGLHTGDSLTVSIPPQKAFGIGGVPTIILPNETILLDLKIIKVNKYHANPATETR
jgi:FKBP-type peptidyl-prolyl cis-trans isomerase